MTSYVVIGLGRFGQHISERLYNMDCDVLSIDINPELVQHMSNRVTRAVVADAQDKEVLNALGVQNLDCAIVAIGNNLAAAVLATLNLKELGVPVVVCKAYDEASSKVLEKIGADRIIIPEKDVAEKLAHSLCAPNVLDYIELSEDYGIIEVPAPTSWKAMSLRELNIRAKLGVNIIAVRQGNNIEVSPPADYVIRKDDIIVVLGDYDALDVVQKM